MDRRRLLLAAIGTLAASCAPSTTAGSRASFDPLLADPQSDVWPAAYRSAPARVQEAYRYAVAHGAVLHYIPCYCGCGQDGHRDNYDCYVRRELGSGRVVLDPHGFG